MVGDQRQSTMVTIGDQTVTAAPGQNSGRHGGHGYSGGGAYGRDGGAGCDGGSDGGDGEDDQKNDGGRGTGEDISSYKMENFVLTPGAGGKYYYDGSYYGGGGGGVMVNGQGPQRSSDNQGEGFGGGGGWRVNGHKGINVGLHGVVLIEVTKSG